MSKWNKTVTRDLPALIGSLHGFCDVDDVTYVLNGIRLGLVKLGQEQRHRYPEMSDAEATTWLAIPPWIHNHNPCTRVLQTGPGLSPVILHRFTTTIKDRD